MQETGVDIVSQGAVWIYGPANMPDFEEKFTKYAMTVAPSTPAELAAMQAEELKKWEGPVKASGFKED